MAHSKAAMSDSDNAKHNETAAFVVASVFGGVGVVAFAANYPVLGWIGMVGFVVILIWMILSTPKKSNAPGEGAASSFAVVGYSCGGGGTGGDCGDVG
jgi:hypothetical protein